MNKFCIQIVLFLLSISVCVNTKSIVANLDPTKDTESKSTKCYSTNDDSDEIYEKNKHLLCINPEETINAEKLMNDAVSKLEYHATSRYGYIFDGEYRPYNMLFYKKKYRNHTVVEKVEYTINDPNKYNELIKRFWDPDSNNFLYERSDKRKIVRVYSPNLVIIQQRWKKWPWSREKYFYVLAAKFEISENKTIIVMTSANINDHNSKNKKPFENTLIKSANLFKTDIDSEDDIRNGKLKKMCVNIMGCIIEKKNKHVDITYVESIGRHLPSYLRRIIRKASKIFPPHK
ncbi:hypothetical protein YYC_04141 [Plasmodium yoelii 17X]|uniref:Fam-a protein n=2 Tax=Plasmodium yoelii TaxID=5861 RepID=A0AAF0B1J7_PLAYO|nr:hypothetical protein YYC_04141 [Plasmodium yoelii 17X]WBY59007.1 fam-a protein [Plasmodium yoelii yoelii]